VTQRAKDIGIRMALGASTTDVQLRVIRQTLTVALVGIAIGVGGALALTRLMASLLFGIRATDPSTFAAMAALLVIIAVIAGYLPARRASRIDPMVTLRAE